MVVPLTIMGAPSGERVEEAMMIGVVMVVVRTLGFELFGVPPVDAGETPSGLELLDDWVPDGPCLGLDGLSPEGDEPCAPGSEFAALGVEPFDG